MGTVWRLIGLARVDDSIFFNSLLSLSLSLSLFLSPFSSGISLHRYLWYREDTRNNNVGIYSRILIRTKIVFVYFFKCNE